MKPTVDFNECLKDSPKFRASLEEAEADIEMLEAKLEKMVKLCSIMIDTGKHFSLATKGFITGMDDLAKYFSSDNLVKECLKKFSDALNEIQRYYNILMDQAHRSVCKNLNTFIKTDIKKVKEAKRHFEKISDEMDNALTRNSQAPKSKPSECEEANNHLTVMRKCFSHTSLDYVFQINVLLSKKRFDVLDTMLSFMHAQNTYFHQGDDLFGDLDPYMKSVAAEVEDLSAKAAVERKEMEERHTLVQKREMTISSPVQPQKQAEDKARIEGYLFKRTSNAFKSWVRRWFSIQERKLVYRKRTKDTWTVMEEDLRLCTVKPVYDLDRRFCFEVLSPARSHMLQADSEAECQMWMTAIQDGVNRAYRETLSGQDTEEEAANDSSQPGAQADSVQGDNSTLQPKQTTAQRRMELLFSLPGNSRCCDCGSAEPRWASTNLGITLCIECSGFHRSLGVHISKVRSITLDTWEPELLKVMTELGNDVVNKIYEARVDESLATRATSDCKRSVREAWIKAKYVQKAFVSKLPGPSDNRSPEGRRIRGWSVCRKTRRSPARSLSKETSESEDDKLDVTSGLLEAVLSVSSDGTGKDNDSGIGGSANDMLVFGTGLLKSDINRSLDLESSEDSCEDEVDDMKSTTSWEDVSKLDPNTLLFKAAQARNLPVMLEALAHGADPNWVNEDDEGKTPLIKAVETGSLAACEFLLLNLAKLDRKDKYGQTPLHHATLLGHTGQVCQFLKRGANQQALDNKGRNPLTIAVSTANADIVTLLRLAKLNQEMKESDVLGNPGDDTFNDVFRDFSNMASNYPEKLVRK
ncbi:arf-GAP with coiled-coil, ANK repeat and PH domain-containing protein 2-like isoform X2 [Liolophura sinensis]|uniref:arf-GAP with coiled-coil, ANK repeat and PH domain-containing protein 2-like isoform X2 n=1 Tax=Liolophura sinensis TaxID=3198878 RepID=UPI003158BC15